MSEDPLERLRSIILRGRKSHGLTQTQAAEAASVTLDQWKSLERGTRRTSIRLPLDLELMDGVARAIGRDSGEELMRQAGLLS